MGNSAQTKTIPAHRLNAIMRVNLIFLLSHLLLYTELPSVLMGLHNAFADLVVAMALTAMVGLWLCLDFMLPVYAEAKVQRQKPVSKPAGLLIFFNSTALLCFGLYWGLHTLL